MSKTVFVLLLSPAGGGKTTLIESTVKRYGTSLSIAVLFNDDGDPEAVDLPRDVRRFAAVDAMTAGCFGCSDADTLIERLEDLDGKVDVVLIEPIGFTAAGEMTDVFTRAGKMPTVVTLVDALHLNDNLRIGTLSGQVAAADHVFVTKAKNAALRDAAHAFIATHASGLPVRTLEKGHPLKLETLRPGHVHTHACDHHHDHGHCHHEDHDHAHDHVHIVPYHMKLRQEATLDELRLIMHSHDVLRAKGTVEASRFSMVHGDWHVEAVSKDAVAYLTFYTETQAAGDQCLAALEPLRINKRYASLGTADEVRDVHDLTLLGELIDQCESIPLTFTAEHPVPNPEVQELLNEVRKRPGASEHEIARAVRARVAHFLTCAEWYLSHPQREDDDTAGARLHAIAVGIAWFASEQPERLSSELIERSRSLPLTRWLAKSLMMRVKLNADIDREEVIADEAAITARWSITHCPVNAHDRELLSAAYRHNRSMAEESGSARTVTAWRDAQDAFLQNQ